MEENNKLGLGDKVEKIIKTIAPELADKNKNCIGCKKRKIWLNNINAIFS